MERSVERKARSGKKGARSSCVCKSSSFSSSRVEGCSPRRQTILVYERRLDDISAGGPLEKCSAFRRAARASFLEKMRSFDAFSPSSSNVERSLKRSRARTRTKMPLFLADRTRSAAMNFSMKARCITKVRGSGFCHCSLLSISPRQKHSPGVLPLISQ